MMKGSGQVVHSQRVLTEDELPQLNRDKGTMVDIAS